MVSCFVDAVTNIARAFQTDPKTFSRVKRVVSMGGALDVPGNTSASAEFNFFADPYVAFVSVRVKLTGKSM